MALVVSSICWVRKGKFAAFPRNALDEVEEEESAPTATSTSTTTTTTTAATDATMEEDPIEKEYGLGTYDEEDDAGLMAGTFYANPEEDPELQEMDDQSDTEETAVLPDDLFVLAATTDAEDEFSHLDVMLFEERDRNMFVHHDYMLAAFPLAIAWLDCRPGGGTGNLAAVSSFDPGIEIWDLDVMESAEPITTLGGFELAPDGSIKARGTGKKKQKAAATKKGSHTDSVMSLSWNRNRREIIASGSADSTVKLWDVGKDLPVHTFSHHGDKVQAVEWCQAEPSVFLSASFDHRVCVIDARTDAVTLEWRLDSDPEVATWVPQGQYRFLVSGEDGTVKCFDAMKGSAAAPAWTIAAHDKAATALAVNPKVPSLIATGSLDRSVKLWTIDGQPSCLYSRDTQSTVFSAAFSEDAEFLLALGTSSGVRVWDTTELSAIRRQFFSRHQAREARKDGKQEVPSAAAASSDATSGAAAAQEEPPEISPPGHGPNARKAKEEKRALREKKKKKQSIPAGALGAKKKRFAKPKFNPKKM